MVVPTRLAVSTRNFEFVATSVVAVVDDAMDNLTLTKIKKT
jgi:hypothetical protein